MPDAHMTEAIHYLLIKEYVICRYEILDCYGIYFQDFRRT